MMGTESKGESMQRNAFKQFGLFILFWILFFLNPLSCANELINPILNRYPAPELKNVYFWINSLPLQLQSLRGQVVLIDFWTYSSIDCLRDLNYINRWYKEYHQKGLMIIGVHAPEFTFEKDFNNVKQAIQQHRIQFPVALDNQFKTWHLYHNQYWPAHYLIDKNGYVVYQHFGEGEYTITEYNIRALLGMKVVKKNESPRHLFLKQTPEIYLGYARMSQWKSPEELIKNEGAEYHGLDHLADNEWAIEGNWIISSDKMIAAKKGALINLHFNSKQVYMVMGNKTGKPIQVKITLNGNTQCSRFLTVTQDNVYKIVDLKKQDNQLLQVIAADPGLEVYMFTFG